MGAADLGPLAVTPAYLAAANAGMSGGRQVYDFHSGSGFVALYLDYTWGLYGTSLGGLFNGVNMVAGGYQYDLSKRSNQQKYIGLMNGSGFAHTQGNVSSFPTPSDEERFGNLQHHEEDHTWQNRIFGPIFTSTYFCWAAWAGAVGTGYAAYTGDNWWKTVFTTSYQDNPWEQHAYRGNNPDALKYLNPSVGF